MQHYLEIAIFYLVTPGVRTAVTDLGLGRVNGTTKTLPSLGFSQNSNEAREKSSNYRLYLEIEFYNLRI